MVDVQRRAVIAGSMVAVGATLFGLDLANGRGGVAQPAAPPPESGPLRGGVPTGYAGTTGVLIGDSPVSTSETSTGRWTGKQAVTRSLVGDAGTVDTVVRVDKREGERLQVLFPIRGAKPVWVSALRVAQTRQPGRLIVDVAKREARYMTAEGVVWAAPVTVGKPSAPTPLGATWVAERVDMPTYDGPYGLWAWGLAMWSDTLTEFGDGDAQLAVHGTNRPEQIGSDVSSGCVRVNNIELPRLEAVGFGVGSIVEFL